MSTPAFVSPVSVGGRVMLRWCHLCVVLSIVVEWRLAIVQVYLNAYVTTGVYLYMHVLAWGSLNVTLIGSCLLCTFCSYLQRSGLKSMDLRSQTKTTVLVVLHNLTICALLTCSSTAYIYIAAHAESGWQVLFCYRFGSFCWYTVLLVLKEKFNLQLLLLALVLTVYELWGLYQCIKDSCISCSSDVYTSTAVYQSCRQA